MYEVATSRRHCRMRCETHLFKEPVRNDMKILSGYRARTPQGLRESPPSCNLPFRQSLFRLLVCLLPPQLTRVSAVPKGKGRQQAQLLPWRQKKGKLAFPAAASDTRVHRTRESRRSWQNCAGR